MQPTNLQEALQYIAKQQQEQLATKIADSQEKMLTVAYDKAASYTTVVIFGGYAGFFGLWQLVKEHLSTQQVLWSALLVLVSLVAFVLFEVVKLVFVSVSVFRQAAPLRDPRIRGNPQHLLEAVEKIQQAQSRVLWPLIVYWAVTVFIALAGALGGAGVLGYAFVCGLLK